MKTDDVLGGPDVSQGADKVSQQGSVTQSDDFWGARPKRNLVRPKRFEDFRSYSGLRLLAEAKHNQSTTTALGNM